MCLNTDTYRNLIVETIFVNARNNENRIRRENLINGIIRGQPDIIETQLEMKINDLLHEGKVIEDNGYLHLSKELQKSIENRESSYCPHL